MSLAGGLREFLRPPPHRGPLIAAGAVALTVGIALEELRLEDRLDTGVHFAILLAVGALVYWLGVQAPNEAGQPPAYQSVLLVTGLGLLYAAFFSLADLLGARAHGLPPAGTIVWTSSLTAGLALWPALERNSAICLLISVVLTAASLLAALSWVFAPGSPTPYRWLLAVYAAALVLGSLALREPAPRHAEQLVNAAGLAIAFIALIGGTPLRMLPGIWEVVLLGAGFGLLAFGALDGAPGPAYLGVINLGLFVFTVSRSREPTLYWWPLVLLAAGAFMLALGLRPRRPLPPEPPAYRAGEAPLAARADGEETVIRVRED